MTAVDLTTYTGLLAAGASWLNRQDLTDQLPAFVTLAEAKFNREIRTRDMMVRANAYTSNEFVPLPTDFLENYTLDMPFSSPRADFVFVPPDEAKSYKTRLYTGTTRYYTTMDNFFELIPAPQSTDTVELIMVYYARIPALATNSTNWLLTKSPDLYLYSLLLEAEPYLKNDERIGVWAAGRQKVMDDIKIEDERALRPSTRLAAKRRSFG